MSRSFIGVQTSGSVPAHSLAARRRYSFCTASSSGEGSISNSVDFSGDGINATTGGAEAFLDA